jgi:hypothetical protein
MKRWKLFAWFKAWQDIKTYQQKDEEKIIKAQQILQKRRKFRMFFMFKIGIVHNRIEYLNEQILYQYDFVGK